jgi:RNA polymerase sigma-70 factor (ECF subfamily)
MRVRGNLLPGARSIPMMHKTSSARPLPLTSALGDEEVVARVLAGETELFEVLMRRHNQRLFRAARAIVQNDAEAEDVMQEAYTRAFAQLGQFQGRAQWSTWVTRIAVNEALGRLRRRGRFVNSDVDEEQEAGMDDPTQSGAPPEGPEDQVAARELSGFLEGAVDALPDIYRSVFVLREVEEMSTAEAAECLGVSEELIKVRLHRARAELRRRLEAHVGSALHNVYSFYRPRCDRVVANVMARIATLTLNRR